MTCWPDALAAMVPSKGSVMKSGSMSAPGIVLGVVEPAGVGRAEQQQVAVVGRGRGERRTAELAVVDHAEVGDPPALRVHGVEHVVLHQRGQTEVLRRERAGRCRSP